MHVRPIAIAFATIIVLAGPAARADDPGAALEQMKQGYALKQAGKCAEAIAHFVESERLDAQPKTLLNLAACEAQLGDLVAAQKHAVEGRDLARQRSNAELTNLAEEQLAALDKRMPKLIIRLAPGAPEGTNVSRDGTELGAVSLGVALPANPGKHVVVAKADGYAQKRFEVVLAEGAQQAIDVAPGYKVASPAPQALAQGLPGAEPSPPAGGATVSTWTARKTIGVVLAGAGLVGVGVGSVFGLMAIGKNNDSNANGLCDSTGCDPTGKQLRYDARSYATISTIAFGAGLAALAGGVVLWATAPAASPQAARVEMAVGAGNGGVAVSGVW